MENLRFKGKLLRQNGIKYIGNGYIKQDDGKEFILNGEDKVEIIPGSLTIENYPYLSCDKMEVSDIDSKQLYKLHEILTDTVIKFLADNNIKSVEEVSFGADGLQASVPSGRWTCFTDSTLAAIGYENGERKLIDESM